MGWNWQEWSDQRGQEIEKVEKNEGQEVFVIFVTQTVVHKGTMMVEFLHTVLTVSAVKGPSRLNNPAVKAEIV